MQMVSTAASPAPGNTFAFMLCGVVGMAAAASLLALYPEALMTRWHPVVLAAVHLFALAGLMPVMLGALFQFVPVACGLVLPHWPRWDALLPLALLLGAAAMAWGFMGQAGALALGAGLVVLVMAAVGVRLAAALWGQTLSGDLLAALRRAVLGLAVTVLAGVLLVCSLQFGWNIPLVDATNWHALWAIAAWLGGLIVAVSSVVVPMFHVSAPYPSVWLKAHRALPLCLVAGSVAAWWGWATPARALAGVLSWYALAFGVLTLRSVSASKRGERDSFYWGWLCLAVAIIALSVLGGLACYGEDARWSIAFGICALFACAGGAINVMLYRIVPFLIWLHWQRHNKRRARLPLLHQIVAERWQRLQLLLFASAALLLGVAPFWPELTRPAASLLVVALILLAVVLAAAMLRYRRVLHQLIAQAPQTQQT